MFACATEPYRGPAQATRAARLSQLGAGGLYQCSNVHVLERLLMTVIRQSATPLRLGSVSRLVAGAAQEATRRTTEFVGGAEALAAVYEKGIAWALDILGLPAPASGDEGYAGFLDSLAALEELRDGMFQVPFPTRTKRYGTDLITAKLAALEADAQARVDNFIEEAMRQRRAPKPGAFESNVFSQADMDVAIETALSEFRDYLARHFELIAQDVRSDLDRLATDQIQLRTSAGGVLKTIGMASSIGGITAGTAGVAAAGIVTVSNPVGWLALAIAGTGPADRFVPHFALLFCRRLHRHVHSARRPCLILPTRIATSPSRILGLLGPAQAAPDGAPAGWRPRLSACVSSCRSRRILGSGLWVVPRHGSRLKHSTAQDQTAGNLLVSVLICVPQGIWPGVRRACLAKADPARACISRFAGCRCRVSSRGRRR